MMFGWELILVAEKGSHRRTEGERKFPKMLGQSKPNSQEL